MDAEVVDTLRRVQKSFRVAGHEDFSGLTDAIEKWEKSASSEEFPKLSVLAHEYGNLGKNGPQQVIDEKLQAFVRFSMEALDRRVQAGEVLNWDKVIETFNQNIFMERDMAMSTDRTKRFETQRSYSVNRFRRSEKDEDIVRELKLWLESELVQDTNIISTMKVPFNKVVNIVARTGPICYKHIRLDNARRGLDFVDVGVIRYPDFYHPYIQVYRICLNAWTSTKAKWAVLQENRNGVDGGLYVRTYRPRQAAIQKALEKAQEMALTNHSSQRS
ncbi:hypothetical protein NMY22_g12961 [Coprinellus aureogranulatus]|nr:hypothetical protein NMY22_g12961 [Coprinellus aureogranulatus]